uniref:Protein TsetseEP domain-containing protein n=1 Tax=Cuerna arida TaxID=1464854 RepID=A0A1B6ESV8_9HEMI
MYCLLLLVVVSAVLFLSQSQGAPSIPEEPRLGWQQILQDVSKSSSLAQVLSEYLADIETVEAATSRCSKDHRDKHLSAYRHLEEFLRQCENSSGRQREALSRCVEDGTERVVSDVRQRINELKTCVDSVG